MTKFSPHKALTSIARGKLTFHERFVLHRVGRTTDPDVRIKSWEQSHTSPSFVGFVRRFRAEPGARMRSSVPLGSDTKSISILETSGNEVYYTSSSLLVIFKYSCGKLHCQKFFKSKSFPYKILQQDYVYGPVVALGGDPASNE